jgi:S-layer protein (TIGR01567 family)
VIYTIKEKIYSWRFAITLLIFISLFMVTADAAGSGNRIWQEGMAKTYTWNPYSFAGFYYNLNDNLGTEEITFHNIDRSIAEGDISYSTSPMEVSFEYSGFGKYQVVGFMAGKYFAGYTANSKPPNPIITVGAKSALSSKQLHRVLIDDDTKRIISVGSTLTLQEGYVLKAKDISVTDRIMLISLLKDGNEVDTATLEAGQTYVYAPNKVGVVSDLPIIMVRFDSVFSGNEVQAAFLKGLFQISETFTHVKTGDRYGEMEIRSVGAGGIKMTNRNSISLSRGNTIDLLGDLKIVVADSDVLRFALSVEKTGAFEVRGTTYPETLEWTPFNFGLNVGGTNLGFYYDMDHDVGKEKLKIEQIDGDSIPEGKLKYSTTPEEVEFEYSGFGKYQVIGFMADRYFAGYTKNSVISNKETKSVFDTSQLHKVLLDDDTKRTVATGSTLNLKDGYVLKMKDIDIGAGEGQILIGLLKDGKEIDTDVVTGRDTYIYIPKKVGNVSELPIIAVHFDSVFRGKEVSAAFVKGVFQISEDFTTVKTGDRNGEMKVDSVNGNGIVMTNRNSISLSSGSTVELMGNIKFKVADSSTLRFYPFVDVTPEMIANQLLIDAPPKATAGDTIMIKVTAGGRVVEGATVGINSDVGNTDKNGNLEFNIKKTLKTGSYNLTATKLGYQKASNNLEIEGYLDNRLVIDAPAMANQLEEITVKITNKELPVSGVTVALDNITIGTTDSSGMLNFTLEVSGTHTIYASKSGLITGARDINIRVPFSEYKALDINAPDVVIADQEAIFSANITNSGTKKDTLPVVLIVNSTEVETISVTLSPKEVKEVIFKRAINLPAGNYTVEVLGQNKLIEVKEAGLNVYMVLGIITVIGVIIIYFLTAKGRTIVKK